LYTTLNKMETNFDDFETESTQRPTFLTVLCILTFIGSGWGIIGSIWSYSTAKQTVNLIHQRQLRFSQDSIKISEAEKLQDSVKVQKRKESAGYLLGHKFGEVGNMLTVENVQHKAIGDLIAALFTLSGALLMWFQKRRGLYIYIIGVLIGIALPFYIYGSGMVTIGIASVGAFFGLLFIALYSLNLKSLYK
jgi:hypothetical protein